MNEDTLTMLYILAQMMVNEGVPVPVNIQAALHENGLFLDYLND